MTARAITDFTAVLDRERDEAFREHLVAEHGYVYAGSGTLPVIANRNRADCETCEQYAESVGTEE